jgi:hypothetical protein
MQMMKAVASETLVSQVLRNAMPGNPPARIEQRVRKNARTSVRKNARTQSISLKRSILTIQNSILKNCFGLCQYVLNDAAVYIGQPIVAACMSERKTLMVQPKQMQNGGMKVVHMHPIFSDCNSKFVA